MVRPFDAGSGVLGAARRVERLSERQLNVIHTIERDAALVALDGECLCARVCGNDGVLVVICVPVSR